MMDRLSTIFLRSENDYINKFCEEYKDPIKTPDGFIIKCIYLRKTAIHFICGGKSTKFQKARAQRLLWAKYILLNPDERKLLIDRKTNNIIFFFDKNRKYYAVICRPIDESKKILELISGFIVSGNRITTYREANPPYEYFQ